MFPREPSRASEVGIGHPSSAHNARRDERALCGREATSPIRSVPLLPAFTLRSHHALFLIKDMRWRAKKRPGPTPTGFFEGDPCPEASQPSVRTAGLVCMAPDGVDTIMLPRGFLPQVGGGARGQHLHAAAPERPANLPVRMRRVRSSGSGSNPRPRARIRTWPSSPVSIRNSELAVSA